MHLREQFIPVLTEIFISALLYVVFFYFNDYTTQQFEAAKGVNWIFIPAGLRIFLTLIFGFTAGLGLAIASLTINLLGYYPLDLISILVISAICGLAPLLGKYVVLKHLKVNPDLSNITGQQLLATIIIYALLSSTLHQLWFNFRGIESGSSSLFLAMLVGDVIGSVLFVGLIKVGIFGFKKLSGHQPSV